MAFPYDWHKSLISDFATTIWAGHPPRVTGSEALHVHRLITAIEASSRSGQKTQVVKG
jgi:predicted dehydrogenase